MIYEVSGGNKAQRKVVDTAMSYVVHLLNIPNNTYIDIILGRFDSHGVIQVSKRSFQLEIHKLVCNAEIAYTVFHEMKHIEQMVAQRLLYANKRALWEGVDHTDTEYFDRPWEIEAYKFEKNADLMLTRIGA